MESMLILAAVVVVPLFFAGVTWLAFRSSGWHELARTSIPELGTPDEVRAFCTIGVSRSGRVSLNLQGTTVRRSGARVELSFALAPSWTAPDVTLDFAAIDVVSQRPSLTLREPQSGIHISAIGRARDVFDRALREATTASVVPVLLLGELARGSQSVDEWITHLRRFGAGSLARGIAPDRETLWDLVANEELTASVRAAAAVVLAFDGLPNAEERRLTQIARTTRNPSLGMAIEVIAAGRDDASLARRMIAVSKPSGS